MDARPARGFLGPPADSCRAEMLPFAGLDSGARRTSRSEETPDSPSGSRARAGVCFVGHREGGARPSEGVERWSESEGAIVSRGWGTGTGYGIVRDGGAAGSSPSACSSFRSTWTY